MNKREEEKLLARIKDLEDFKLKVETGSKWLWCAIYTIGSIVLFLVTVFTFLKEFIHYK